MAYLDKKAYEGKKEYVRKRNLSNKEIATENGLSSEQIEFLNSLCSFRHRLHTSWEAAFNSESGEYKTFFNEISEYTEDNEYTLRYKCNKLFNKYPFSRIDYPADCDLEIDDEYKNLEEAKDFAFEKFEEINTEIETFLKEIDGNYHTNYCPSGVTRIF